MGLLARWEFPRKERPVSADRTADTFGFEGASETKFTVYRPPGGVGSYQVFYTVPTGKVFLLRGVTVEGGNVCRVDGLDTFEGGTVDFDPPIKYPSGTQFSGFGNVAADLIKIWGVEEDQTVQAARNFI